MVALKHEFNYECKRVTYFYCYNPKLRKFLDQNGTRWIGKDTHRDSGRPYWIFERTARLGGLLDEYHKD